MTRNQSNSNNATGQNAMAISIGSLLPLDTTPFKQASNPWFIWFTIFLVWLISLLPWRLWQPAPDLLLLVLAFWCVNEPQRVNMLAAFLFGLLMDVHDANLLGAHALVYTLAAYGAVTLTRRLQRFNVVVQALHMLPVLLGAEGVSRLIYAWLVSEWAGWQWVWSALFTAALWPLAEILLHMPQRRLDEAGSGPV
jgi:rod shape-determining protein MreD